MSPQNASSITLLGRPFKVTGPSLKDPRLHVTATIMSLHVLGQTVLGFELSIAQILASLFTCAALELVITGWEKGLIAWPASALLTGNGVAFVLRVNGTEHGDWWSLTGWYIFAATSALGLLTKYVVRVGGRQVFNPSNVALVVCFVVLGTGVVNPLDFWWGPWSWRLALVYVVLAAGAFGVTRRLGLLPLALAFWTTLGGGLAVVAATGHCMSARWSITPVCGQDFWWTVVMSPEVLVFLLFMTTDPKSIPSAGRSRLLFGFAVGVVAVLLVAPARTEFWAKVSVLGALVVVHVARAVLAQRVPSTLSLMRPLPAVVAAVALAAIAVVAGMPARTPSAAPATVDIGVLDSRPALDIGAVPPVTIGDGASPVLGGIDQAQAERIGRDLIEGLEIERLALSDGDHGLLASAVAGPRLEHDLAGGGTATDVGRVETLTLVVVRDPVDPQALPRVGMWARGEGVDSVFALVEVGGTFLVTEERAPDRALRNW